VQELLLHQVKVKETFQNIDKMEGKFVSEVQATIAKERQLKEAYEIRARHLVNHYY
jgi:hypothetical protein